MKKWNRAPLPPSATTLKRQIAEWRRTCRRVSPIPVELWNAAVSLATEHGVCRIAHSLRIDFGALKRRVAAATAATRERGAEPAFIELPGAALVPQIGEALLELSDETGGKMTCMLAPISEGHCFGMT